MPFPATLRANTLGMEAYRRLRGGLSDASVHSCYDGAINIMTGLGLTSLVPASVGRGPINITVDGDFRQLASSVVAGDPVIMSAEVILIGGSTPLSLAGSGTYDPPQTFLHPVLDHRLVRRNLQLARETTFIHGRFTGMGSLLHSLRGETLVSSELGLNMYSRRALEPLRALISGLGENSLRGVRAAAKRIAGLGIGLTPSADDILSGLIVALTLSEKNGLVSGHFCHRAARAIAKSTMGRSNVLSQEYMEQASLGRSNEKVTGLVESIYTRSPPEVAVGASDLISMGHASGTDTIVGVMLGIGFVLQAHAKRRMA